MIQFTISAPGKVILFGEHSVVYGKVAVAGSVGLRTKIHFRQMPSSESSIQISMPATELERSISIQTLQDHFLTGDYPEYHLQPDRYSSHVENFIKDLKYENNAQKMALHATIFVLISVHQMQGIQEIRPFSIRTETELSIGSGLGSSASFSVCLASSFFHYTNLLKEKSQPVSSPDFQSQVDNLAFSCEKIMHGTPSGVDNTICTYGSLVRFEKFKGYEKLQCDGSLKVLLVDTRVPRSTKALVQSVADLKAKYPEVVGMILEAMGGVAMAALEVVKGDEDMGGEMEERFRDLGKLVEINQGLLSALGVSHPTLDTICLEAKSCGFSAKLTGAGGGGYAYVVIPPNSSDDKIQNLTEKLTGHGFHVQLTTIGGPGVTLDSDTE